MLFFRLTIDKDIIEIYLIELINKLKEDIIYIVLVVSRAISQSERQYIILIGPQRYNKGYIFLAIRIYTELIKCYNNIQLSDILISYYPR